MARLDVSGERGTKVYQELEVRQPDFQRKNSYQEFRLPFSLGQEDELEFRVYSYNLAPFWIDRISVARQP